MKLLRRIAISLVGGLVLALGIVMIVLPAPAILVIPAGLAILALEFAWARYCLRRIREFLAQKKDKAPASEVRPNPASSPPPLAK